MEGGVGTVKPENWEVKGMRKGMTLVELLIVIGIIVVLAGLTFSVILQARRRGQLAACISNLKQLVLAVHAYENDWGMVPIEFHHETSEGVFGRVEQILFPYVRDENLFICPEDPYKGESDIRGGRVVWKGKKWKMSYYYFVNDFTVKEYLGYEMTRPFPDLVLFNCPWHPKVELIARYDGRIEIAPSGRYRRIGMITTP
jgi:prepilin-type N-terminal cleavage/methylation domain-containing protein